MESKTLTDLTLGALAGGIATAAMGQVSSALYAREGTTTRWRENWARGGDNTHVIAARKAAGLFGARLSGPEAAQVGDAIHYALGSGSGAAYAAARPHIPLPAPARGLALGALLWLVADEIATPAAGLTPWARAFPWQTHARGLAAHLTYGLVTEGVLSAVRLVPIEADPREPANSEFGRHPAVLNPSRPARTPLPPGEGGRRPGEGARPSSPARTALSAWTCSYVTFKGSNPVGWAERSRGPPRRSIGHRHRPAHPSKPPDDGDLGLSVNRPASRNARRPVPALGPARPRSPATPPPGRRRHTRPVISNGPKNPGRPFPAFAPVRHEDQLSGKTSGTRRWLPVLSAAVQSDSITFLIVTATAQQLDVAGSVCATSGMRNNVIVFQIVVRVAPYASGFVPVPDFTPHGVRNMSTP